MTFPACIDFYYTGYRKILHTTFECYAWNKIFLSLWFIRVMITINKGNAHVSYGLKWDNVLASLQYSTFGTSWFRIQQKSVWNHSKNSDIKNKNTLF